MIITQAIINIVIFRFAFSFLSPPVLLPNVPEKTFVELFLSTHDNKAVNLYNIMLIMMIIMLIMPIMLPILP